VLSVRCSVLSKKPIHFLHWSLAAGHRSLSHFLHRSPVTGHRSLLPAGRKRKASGLQPLVLLVAVFTALACSPALAGDEWKQAIGERAWSFPRDHGAHPEFRTEWWYFTGNLRDGAGNRYGYQLTFFRQGVRLKPADPKNPWSLRDLYPAHFAVTDVSNGMFRFAEQITRSGPGLSGASVDGMNVWNLGWSAKMKGDTIHLQAAHEGLALSLVLKPRKPLTLQGAKGLSRRGPGNGQASYYYSFTDLATRGTIRTDDSQMPVAVEGVSWFDQEFGSNVLSKDQVGWDWFSIHLSDGRDLMLFFLRKKDGTVEKESSGTLVESDGKSRHLKRSEISVEVLGTWKSPKSSGTYPNRWRVRILAAGLDLELATLVAAQELITAGSTGVTYWEGAVDGKGASAGRPVTCEGYVEMTGYAGSLGGLF
jgi:predicted secreted hydrolase